MYNIPIIDSGHGSNTPGKRSIFHVKNGKHLLLENSFNEAVANKLSMLLHQCEYKNYFISNEWWDISLSERVKRERHLTTELRSKGESSVFISIHADAYGKTLKEGNKASGSTFFYASEKGKVVAEHFTSVFEASDYPIKMRSPKKANYKVLRDTKCPAVLWEGGFMTNDLDLEKILEDRTRNIGALTLLRALETLPNLRTL